MLLILKNEYRNIDTMKKRLRRKNDRRKKIKWIVSITLTAFLVSVFLTVFSEIILKDTGIIVSLIVLIFIVSIGVLADAIGIAVATAEVNPFNSMASAKVKGASQALKLVRNAGRVSSICCDVIGDICGILSGATTAIIVVVIGKQLNVTNISLLAVLLSGIVTAMTVGGKAAFKDIAIGHSKQIVFACGKIVAFFDRKTK